MAFSNGYTYRRTILTTKDKIPSTLTNFPLLIQGTYPFLRTTGNGGKVTSSSGNDIRFELPDGTKLDHEIEEYNASTGKIAIWVRVPSLTQSSNRIRIYYGKSGASAEANPTGVWDSDHKAVYHFNNNPAGSSPALKDSTSGARHGTMSGSMTSGQQISAEIGTGIDFDGSNDFFTVSHHADLNPTQDMTLMFIVRPDALPGSGSQASIFEKPGSFALRLDNVGGTYMLNLVKYTVTDQQKSIFLPAAQYTIIHVVQRATKVDYYVNGYLWDSFNNSTAFVTNTNNMVIGQSGSSSRWWNGVMDELRKINRQLTDDEILAQYYNYLASQSQNLNTPFTEFTGEEQYEHTRGFRYKRTITVSNSYNPFSLDILGTTFLVSETLADLKSVANGGKVFYASSKPDIRFETADGDAIAYELERYDETTGQIIAWLRLPIYKKASNTSVVMRYGKYGLVNDITHTEEKKWVWQREFTGVYHMAELASGSSPQMLNSVTQANDLVAAGSPASGTRVASQIGYGFDGDTSDDALVANNNLGISTTAFWIVGWVNIDTSSRSGIIAGAGREQYIGVGNGSSADVAGNNIMMLYQNIRWANLGTWGTGRKFFAIRFSSNGTAEVYINGSWINYSPGSAATQPFINPVIGRQTGSGRMFTGADIDEVRFTNLNGWNDNNILMMYNSQRPSVFYSMGSEVVTFAEGADEEAEGDADAIDSGSYKFGIQEGAGEAEGEAEAEGHMEFPDLRGTAEGEAEVEGMYPLVNPIAGEAAEGDSEGEADADWIISGRGDAEGDAESSAEVTRYSPDLEKTYEYRIYTPSGQYLTSWDVISSFEMAEAINSPGGPLTIKLARDPYSFGEGVDVDFNNEVRIFVADRELPNGKCIFKGFITDYSPSFGDKTVEIIVMPYGFELDSQIIEAGEIPYQSQEVLHYDSGGFDDTPVYWFGNDRAGALGIGQQFEFPEEKRMSGISLQLITKMDTLNGIVNLPFRIQIYQGNILDWEPGDVPVFETTATINFATLQETKFVFGSVYTVPEDTPHFFVLVYDMKTGLSNNYGPIGVGFNDDDANYTGGSAASFDSFLGGWNNAEVNPTFFTGDLWFKLWTTNSNTTVTYNSYDPSDILKSIIDDYNLRGGKLVYTPESIDDTGTEVSYEFQTNTCLEGINKVLELAPANWYWYIDHGEGVIHFHEKTEDATHKFNIGKEVQAIDIKKVTQDIENVVYFVGGGDPPLYKKYARETSVGNYGIRAVKISDERVTLESSADIIAERYLDAHANPVIIVDAAILDSNKNDYGYDLESVTVGDVVAIGNAGLGASTKFDEARFDESPFDYDLANIGTIRLQVTELKRTKFLLGITLSTKPPDINKRIEDIRRNLEATKNKDNPSAPDV